MITKIISIFSLLLFLWMLVGGARQFTEKHKIEDKEDFYSELFLLVALLFGVISLIAYIIFGEVIVISLKQSS